LATLTSRQIHILSIVQKLGRPHVNDLVHNEESPTRLKANLEQLVDKRCLHMDPEGGRRKCYTVTKTGLRQLVKHEAHTVENSRLVLIDLKQIDETLVTKVIEAAGYGWMHILDVDRDLPHLNIPRYAQPVEDETLKGNIEPFRARETGGPTVPTRSRVLTARKREN